MNKFGLYQYVYDFSVDYNSIRVDNTLNIHNNLMKEHDMKCLDWASIYCIIKYELINMCSE